MNAAYSIIPEPSSIEGGVAIFDVKSRKFGIFFVLLTLTNIHFKLKSRWILNWSGLTPLVIVRLLQITLSLV